MDFFKKAKWIWANSTSNVDDYAEFSGSFISNDSTIAIKIACDSVYAFFINNRLVKFMACSDYPNDKYADCFSYRLKKPNNTFKIQVWHYGADNAHYINDLHGVIFEINDSSGVLSFSNEKTLSRIMNEFKNGYAKQITKQLGFSFYFDNTIKKNKYTKSILINKNCNFSLRQLNDFNLLDRLDVDYLYKENSIIVDLKKETAGFIDVDIDSETDQELLISFGEHIIDGGVRRFIEERDFSIEIKLKKGRNRIFNPLLRIAGRYLQLYPREKIGINYVGIRPVKYHHDIIKKTFDDPLLNDVYRTCINTLELCMHEHYEDCPWREQSLYVLDSRNQMLCGYYAFEGFEYQKHNLLLISKSLDKETGLLTLTAPQGGLNYPIPFFSLIFIKQVEEYVKYTHDTSVLKGVKNTLDTIVMTFTKRVDSDDLIPYFESPFWNFYDWTSSNANDNDIFTYHTNKKYELIINAAYVYFVDIYNKLFNEHIDLTKVKSAIKNKLLLVNDSDNNKITQLASAFICLIGLGKEEHINNLLKEDDIEEASLSTRCFVYDALLMYGNKYQDFIINDIKKRYKKMLDDGATSFYETEQGASSFNGAGSLCHGWSALPVYYLSILIK